MELSQTEKSFAEVLDSFSDSILNFKHFEKKVNLIAFIFPNLPTPKTWLDKYLKGPVSEEVSTSNMTHVHKHCSNHHRSIVIIFIDHCEVNCVGKVSLIDMQILGLLVNTLAGDKGYPVLSRDNLTIPIQMQVSGKEKTFSHFLAAFLKST